MFKLGALFTGSMTQMAKASKNIGVRSIMSCFIYLILAFCVLDCELLLVICEGRIFPMYYNLVICLCRVLWLSTHLLPWLNLWQYLYLSCWSSFFCPSFDIHRYHPHWSYVPSYICTTVWPWIKFYICFLWARILVVFQYLCLGMSFFCITQMITKSRIARPNKVGMKHYLPKKRGTLIWFAGGGRISTVYL